MAAARVASAWRSAPVTVRTIAEVIELFRAALAARDIVPPAQVIADDSIHGCDAVGKYGKGVPLVARIV
jgi:hypothetical protein